MTPPTSPPTHTHTPPLPAPSLRARARRRGVACRGRALVGSPQHGCPSPGHGMVGGRRAMVWPPVAQTCGSGRRARLFMGREKTWSCGPPYAHINSKRGERDPRQRTGEKQPTFGHADCKGAIAVRAPQTPQPRAGRPPSPRVEGSPRDSGRPSGRGAGRAGPPPTEWRAARS